MAREVFVRSCFYYLVSLSRRFVDEAFPPVTPSNQKNAEDPQARSRAKLGWAPSEHGDKVEVMIGILV
jgi:hypothetical protein